MQRVIGSPCLAHRIFDFGYKNRLGFSYWEREQNALTNVLFSEFPQSQLYRVTTFEEILDTLTTASFERKTFIQIIRNGLDSLCHYHREKPDIEYMLSQFKMSIERIVEAINRQHRSMRLFMTADHGILWFDNQVTASIAQSEKPRYLEGLHRHEQKSCLINENGTIYTALTGNTAITRNRKVTEWEFHGGISVQESLVPFFEITLQR